MPEHESYEAFIERMAGACPPPGWVDTGLTVYDVPVDPDDPTCHSNVGRRVYRNDDEDVPVPPERKRRTAHTQVGDPPDAAWFERRRLLGEIHGDWPMPPGAPTTPPDDEALGVPDE